MPSDCEGEAELILDDDGDRDAGASFITLKTITEQAARQLGSGSAECVTWVSLALMAGLSVIAVPVPVPKLADFLNEVGERTASAGLVDVQFALQRRSTKAADGLQAIHGIALDVDRGSADPLGDLQAAGLPVPTCFFNTVRGYRAVYACATEIPSEDFIDLARRAVLALEGADPGSWQPSQFQRLPICFKSTPGGTVRVAYPAVQTNAVPLDATAGALPFPGRLLRLLGSSACTAGERELIREYLDELGISAPDPGTSFLYATCPAVELHDTPCSYVNVDEAGRISVHCLGGHGGEGAKHWSERDLVRLAGAHLDEDSVNEAFDPLTDLPITAATIEYVKFQLRDWSELEQEAAVQVLAREWARRESRGLVNPNIVLDVYSARLRGMPDIGPVSVYFDRVRGKIAFEDSQGHAYSISREMTIKLNAHEALSTAAHILEITQTEKGVIAEPGWAPYTASLLNKLSGGYKDALRALGVAEVTRHDLPIAHVSEHWEIAPATRHIRATLVTNQLETVPEIDAVEFFLDRWRRGLLPLATENDARLFIALIASPLLRELGAGQLGVYWLVGPPGAGKDFLAEMGRHVWETVNTNAARLSFDLNIAGDLELKRSLEMAGGCIYGRAKEAGKRAGMAEILIRLAGTDSLSVRGLWKDERTIPNTFTIVADSAEDLPQRREISRRTVMITVAFIDDTVSKGAVLDEVRRAGPALLKNLKRLVESRPPEWYQQQASTGSRPLIPVALATLFGATLPEVQGEDLAELFEAMLAFTESAAGAEEGQAELLKAQKRRHKESTESCTFASYRFSYFIALSRDVPGNRELFAAFGDTKVALVNRIMRESEYGAVRAGTARYMRVEIMGRPYAFRIEVRRRFILVPELEYLTKMTPGATTTASSAAEASSMPAESAAPTFQFDTDDLAADGKNK